MGSSDCWPIIELSQSEEGSTSCNGKYKKVYNHYLYHVLCLLHAYIPVHTAVGMTMTLRNHPCTPAPCNLGTSARTTRTALVCLLGWTDRQAHMSLSDGVTQGRYLKARPPPSGMTTAVATCYPFATAAGKTCVTNKWQSSGWQRVLRINVCYERTDGKCRTAGPKSCEDEGAQLG